MQVLVAGDAGLAALDAAAVLARARAEDTMAGSVGRDLAQPLDVNMHELAGMAPLVAVGWLERVEAGALAEADPLQPQRHGRERQPQHLGDLGRGHPHAPQALDRLDTLLRQPPRRSLRPRRAIQQLNIAAPVAADPLSNRPCAAARSLGDLLQRPTLLEHPPTDQPATARTAPMISVELHPGSSLELGGFDTPSLQGGPDEQPR
jgi:hypothetical protein